VKDVGAAVPGGDAYDHEMVTCWPFTVAVTPLGAAGSADGLTELEVPAAPDPVAFLATTEKVYVNPSVSPVMVALVAVVVTGLTENVLTV